MEQAFETPGTKVTKCVLPERPSNVDPNMKQKFHVQEPCVMPTCFQWSKQRIKSMYSAHLIA